MVASNTTASAYRLRVSLEGCAPEIWREVIAPANFSMADLHLAIQVSMGWTDSHLHCFRVGRHVISSVAGQEDVENDDLDERTVSLGSLELIKGSYFEYEYDFGDGWIHLVECVELISEEVKRAFLLGGERACPPEDCGGVWGYQDLLAALEDPDNPDSEETLEWLGGDFDPEFFDLAEANDLLSKIIPTGSDDAPDLGLTADELDLREEDDPRACPGLAESLSAEECRRRRNHDILCPPTCPYNPFGDNYIHGLDMALTSFFEKTFGILEGMGGVDLLDQTRELLGEASPYMTPPMLMTESMYLFLSGDQGSIDFDFLKRVKMDPSLVGAFDNDEWLLLELFLASRACILQIIDTFGEESGYVCSDPFGRGDSRERLRLVALPGVWKKGDVLFGRLFQRGDRVYNVAELETVDASLAEEFLPILEMEREEGELEGCDFQNMTFDELALVLEMYDELSEETDSEDDTVF